jgi:hypothetical protein
MCMHTNDENIHGYACIVGQRCMLGEKIVCLGLHKLVLSAKLVLVQQFRICLFSNRKGVPLHQPMFC